jgi:glycosyltransferase involved in cell wall biosynthesis
MPQLGYQEYFLPKWNHRHGHEVHIVTSDRYRPVQDYDDTWGGLLGARILSPGLSVIEGIQIHRLPVAFEWKVRPWLRKMKETIQQIGPDVLFVHGTASPMAFSAARLARRLGLPLLMDNHMIFSSRNQNLWGAIYYQLLRSLSPRVLGRATYRFLGVANECCDFLTQEQGIDPSLIECLPLGVDTDLFHPMPETRAETRRRWGIPLEAQVILQTGKLSPPKAPHLLVGAVAPLLRADPLLCLVFVGGGSKEYLTRTRALAESLGVAAQTHFVPLVPVADLAVIYAMADLAVYPGGTSLSCLEASACQVPAIMTDLPANRWRAEHGIGVCFKDGDVQDLRRTLDRLIRDTEWRREVSRRGRAAALKHFSYDAVAQRSEQLMREAIAAHDRNRRQSNPVASTYPSARAGE